ncbi:polysaccharide biosynthesis/export family protein [Oceanidesulfovibrio marinus]|uniref:Polysaccharide export outer membrane protein n=1 Tax=Oceanidesulfovibrio marinus TaxID=370038 RepID=A0ABX6NK97_9BACT|nr:polysaccharide biosynthesis/export family protein [Oceanidesulfovibrio marinus]QJT11087.1 hypothetical protein E8L03_20180 [Oceanidesulfovibrio marinus]
MIQRFGSANTLTLIAALTVLLALVGCGGSSQTVIRSEAPAQAGASDDAALSGLDQEEVELLQTLQQSTQPGELSSQEAGLVRASTTMSPSEYLAKYGSGSVDSDYQVGGEDILSIYVYEQPELTRELVPVSGDGFISFPFVGALQVAGMTTEQIGSAIRAKLMEGGYLIDPQVSVVVKEYKSKTVLILGAVETPGRYQLESNETLLDILSRAEGVSLREGGNLNRASLVRIVEDASGRQTKVSIEFDLRRLLSGQDHLANLALRDGDVIYVPMADKVYVMGEVQNPGAFVMGDNQLNIVEAIGLAGGFTRLAAPNRTKIVRKDGGVDRIFIVDVDDITEGDGQGFIVKPNDIVIVPESFF